MLRFVLEDADPAVWRSVQVPSTLTLAQLHDLLQAAFGWEDYHLHRFSIGGRSWDRGAEHFLCPSDVEEGEDDGVPDREVRLDELLVEPGDSVNYVYDYGDNWDVTVLVTSVAEATDVQLLDGHGGSPPEDCGGIGAWNDDRDDAPANLEALREAVGQRVASWALPPVLRELLPRLEHTSEQPRIAELLARSRVIDAPGEIAAAAERYRWMLDQVGEGIALTQAGYLPPRLVEAAMTELQLDPGWIGKANREDLTPAVSSFRASAQALGIVRVLKGKLVPTKVGKAVRRDPEGLARHVVERFASSSRTPFERELTAVLLLLVAAGRPLDAEATRIDAVELLTALGWHPRGGRLSPWGLLHYDGKTRDVLTSLGCRDGSASPEVRELAREVLRAMP